MVKYVVMAESKVLYCETRAEAIRLARQANGRAYRADWTEITEA